MDRKFLLLIEVVALAVCSICLSFRVTPLNDLSATLLYVVMSGGWIVLFIRDVQALSKTRF